MERAVFKTILEQREEEHEAGRNVATPQCRDVSTNSVSTSLKAEGPEIEWGSENVRTRARKALQQQPRSAERRLVFVFSSFLENC